ncbi:MAG TPA: ATP-binding cassette domain-containing protein [Albitalea sp.]|nr:ATP-binding cassette domain-containing protein [Albitalea sp.]
MQLELSRLAVRHPAARAGALAIADVSLRVARGEVVAVIGPSGAGKTTLLHAIACALRPEQGEIRLMGESPWTMPRRAVHRLRARLFLAPQTPPLPPRQRVVIAVLAGRLAQQGFWASLRSLLYPREMEAARAALARFDMADKLFERVDRLSGGERQRVGLARALVSGAELVLIDEPLSALDPTRAQQAIASLLSAAQESGATLITTLHQVDVARAHFRRIVGLRAGRVAFDAPTEQVSDAMLRELYADHEDELTGAAPPAEPVEPEPIALTPCR